MKELYEMYIVARKLVFGVSDMVRLKLACYLVLKLYSEQRTSDSGNGNHSVFCIVLYI